MVYFYLFFLDLGNVNNNRERKFYERKLLLNPITRSHAIVKDNAYIVIFFPKTEFIQKYFVQITKILLLK